MQAQNVLVVAIVVLGDVAIREGDEEQAGRRSAREKNVTLMMMLINDKVVDVEPNGVQARNVPEVTLVVLGNVASREGHEERVVEEVRC